MHGCTGALPCTSYAEHTLWGNRVAAMAAARTDRAAAPLLAAEKPQLLHVATTAQHAIECPAHLQEHGIQGAAQLLHGVHLSLDFEQVARRGPRILGHLGNDKGMGTD